MRFREPGWVQFQRKTESTPILEPFGIQWPPRATHYVVHCVVGGAQNVLIRWRAADAAAVRLAFKAWLTPEWCMLTTDFYGVHFPNGYEFKSALIDRFGVGLVIG